jgi:hypothetical protein
MKTVASHTGKGIHHGGTEALRKEGVLLEFVSACVCCIVCTGGASGPEFTQQCQGR